MINSGSLDTNTLLRSIIADVPKQTEAITRHLKQLSMVEISDIAMIETLFVLDRYYKLPRNVIKRTLQKLIQHPELNFNRKLFLSATDLYVSHPAWSIEDCCLVAYAELHNATPLWTFDEKLAKQSSGKAKLVPL